MDRTDLMQATILYRQTQEIHQALDVLDRQATITAITITPKENVDTIPELSGARTVPTTGLAYPPQMMDAIRAQLQARLKAINSELVGLGVTPEESTR